MQARELLNLLTVAERLKDTTRHCYTSNGQGHSDVYHSRFGGSIHGGYSGV